MSRVEFNTFFFNFNKQFAQELPLKNKSGEPPTWKPASYLSLNSVVRVFCTITHWFFNKFRQVPHKVGPPLIRRNTSDDRQHLFCIFTQTHPSHPPPLSLHCCLTPVLCKHEHADTLCLCVCACTLVMGVTLFGTDYHLKCFLGLSQIASQGLVWLSPPPTLCATACPHTHTTSGYTLQL